jgi:hypothetical protein
MINFPSQPPSHDRRRGRENDRDDYPGHTKRAAILLALAIIGVEIFCRNPSHEGQISYKIAIQLGSGFQV